jgi:hypothetical protein
LNLFLEVLCQCPGLKQKTKNFPRDYSPQNDVMPQESLRSKSAYKRGLLRDLFFSLSRKLFSVLADIGLKQPLERN